MIRDRLANFSNAMRIASDLRTRRAVAGVILEGRRMRHRGTGSPDPVELRVEPLGGQPIAVRPGTTDLSNVVAYLTHALYLPPPEVRGSALRRICELGTNIGAALSGLAHTYPDARLLGIEPDDGNIAVARRNVARYGDRVRVIEAAVWDEPGVVQIERETGRGEHGFAVVPARDVTAGGLPAMTIDQVLDELESDPGIPIDYMHVSLEGSEERVFAAGGAWAERVRSLRVEAHPYLDYPAARVVEQLEALGYRAWPAPELPEKWIYAVR